MTRTEHLTPELAIQWAASAQYYFLDALMADPEVQYEQIAFRVAWLLSREARIVTLPMAP